MPPELDLPIPGLPRCGDFVGLLGEGREEIRRRFDADPRDTGRGIQSCIEHSYLIDQINEIENIHLC